MADNDTFRFQCNACGYRARIPAKFSGSHIKCPGCGSTQLADPSSSAGPSTGDTVAIKKIEQVVGDQRFRFVCADCGYRARIPVRFAGMAIKCPGCGKPQKAQPQDEAPISGETVTFTPPPVPAQTAASSHFRFVCSTCGYRARIPAAYGGVHIKCPGCKATQLAEPEGDQSAATGKTVEIRVIERATASEPTPPRPAPLPVATPVQPAAAKSAVAKPAVARPMPPEPGFHLEETDPEGNKVPVPPNAEEAPVFVPPAAAPPPSEQEALDLLAEMRTQQDKRKKASTRTLAQAGAPAPQAAASKPGAQAPQTALKPATAAAVRKPGSGQRPAPSQTPAGRPPAAPQRPTPTLPARPQTPAQAAPRQAPAKASGGGCLTVVLILFILVLLGGGGYGGWWTWGLWNKHLDLQKTQDQTALELSATKQELETTKGNLDQEKAQHSVTQLELQRYMTLQAQTGDDLSRTKTKLGDEEKAHQTTREALDTARQQFAQEQESHQKTKADLEAAIGKIKTGEEENARIKQQVEDEQKKGQDLQKTVDDLETKIRQAQPPQAPATDAGSAGGGQTTAPKDAPPADANPAKPPQEGAGKPADSGASAP